MARIGEELRSTWEGRLSAMVIETIRKQIHRIEEFNKDIAEIEKRLQLWKKEDGTSQRLMDIPGVGILTATAAVATMGDAKTFKKRS